MLLAETKGNRYLPAKINEGIVGSNQQEERREIGFRNI